MTFTYSLSDPLPSGTGNTNAHPAFMQMGTGSGLNHVPGNYRLTAESPARDTGENLSWAVVPDARDLDGKKRLVGSNVDMGAYECQPPAGTVIMIR